jgi:anti-sigma factor RsiW
MNVINFNEKACQTIRRYFDSYLDNELLVETNHEVLQHLAACAACTRVLQERARLKQAVQHAVQEEKVPVVLMESIRQAIHAGERRSFFASDLGRRAMAVAAALILVIGGVVALRTGSVFGPAITSSVNALEVISAQAQEIMRVGLVNHVHCTLALGRWKQFFSFEDMQQATGRTALGPEFIGLVPMVKDRLGSSFQIVQGHRCRANRRDYVHLILTGQNGAILSLVITEKNGETFTRADLAATLDASGVSVYSASQGQLEIAGFETNRFLAYVVSNLDRNANLELASTLAPSVHEYLRRLEV